MLACLRARNCRRRFIKNLLPEKRKFDLRILLSKIFAAH